MATFTGTNGNDQITGTDSNDTITGAGGNDFLAGGSGDDSVAGGTGNDTIYGDAGNDWVEGGAPEGDPVLLPKKPDNASKPEPRPAAGRFGRASGLGESLSCAKSTAGRTLLNKAREPQPRLVSRLSPRHLAEPEPNGPRSPWQACGSYV